MSIQKEFLSQVLGEAPPVEQNVVQLSTDQLVALEAEAAALQGRSQAARLESDNRERLAGKRSPALPDMLLQCAAGLRKNKAFASEIGIPAALVKQTADQDGALGRLVKATSDAHEGATAAATQVADDAQSLGEQVLRAAEKRAADRPGERTRIGAAFADAFRLYDDARTRTARAGARLSRRLRPQREALAGLQAETEELRLLHKVLDEGGRSDV